MRAAVEGGVWGGERKGRYGVGVGGRKGKGCG